MRFSDALDRKLEEINRPPNLPVGHYIWTISKHPETDELESQRTGKTFDRLTFNLTCVSASDDVDPDELEAYGNVAGAMNRKTFLFDTDPEEKAGFERSLFDVKRFLTNCGVDADSMGLSEALAASVGTQFLGELTHRPDPNDSEIIYTEVRKTAPV